MFAPEAFLRVLSVLTMLGLAGWLLYLDRRSPLHLTFSGFLVMRAVLLASPFLAESQALAPTVGHAAALVQILAPFLVPFFLYNFQRCHCIAHVHGSYHEKPLLWFYMVSPFVFAALFLLWPDLYAMDRALVLLDPVAAGVGPLYATRGLDLLAFAFFGLLFFVEIAESPTPLHRYSYLSVSLGFTITALYEGLAYPLVTFVTAPGPSALPWPVLLGFVWSLGAAAIALRVGLGFNRLTVRSPEPAVRALRRPVLGTLCAAAISAMVVAPIGMASPLVARHTAAILLGLFSFAIPVLVSYAILRHHLFDIDLKFRLTIKRGVVAAAFVAVFFAASEGTQAVLQDRWGPVAGIAASSLVVLFLAPLQRRAERFAEAAVPMAQPTNAWSLDERKVFYREQVHIAWGDGGLNKKERALLLNLRAKLGLSAEEAERIEGAALGEHWVQPAPGVLPGTSTPSHH
ncbi:MAG: hypothetical protein HYT80_05095 [Euryarchaeota archaeon]|nr:hypothetical protein [Euryarchaeota archaeon]